jgi:hypothetical protein
MHDADFMAGGAQPFDQQSLPEAGAGFRNEDF